MHHIENNMYGDIGDFHEKFQLQYDGPPRQLPDDILRFRVKFLVEELCEYVDLSDTKKQLVQSLFDEHLKENEHKLNNMPPLEKQFDALIDLVYVALGTSYLQGFDFDEGWRRVQAANMRKVRAERAGDSTRGSVYDVVKPEGWKPPVLTDLV